MTHPWISWHRLSPRGSAGLACDQHGVALGPVALVASRQGRYRLRSPGEIAEALTLAYGMDSLAMLPRWYAGLGRIAKALEEGKDALAAIAAVQLGLPEIAPERMEKLARSSLAKDSNPDEPRVPPGNSDGGDWTGGGGGVQVAENDSVQSDAPKHSPYVKMTTRQVGNIVFNETRSLSGPDIDNARVAIAHIVRNGEDQSGADRPRTAPSDVGDVPQAEMNIYTYMKTAKMLRPKRIQKKAKE